MDQNKLRFILALLITGGYVGIVGSVIAAVILDGLTFDAGHELIEEISKVMAGFIGLIIGFYFSRSRSD